MTGTKKSADHTPCHVCHVQYGDRSDQRKYEAWMMCDNCSIWVHQSCGLEHGIEDDDGTYNCASCLD